MKLEELDPLGTAGLWERTAGVLLSELGDRWGHCQRGVSAYKCSPQVQPCVEERGEALGDAAVGLEAARDRLKGRSSYVHVSVLASKVCWTDFQLCCSDKECRL